MIAAVGAAGGVGGAIFAWVQAKTAVDERKDAQAAQTAAENARDEALAAARQSAAAAERQADALEAANALLADSQALNERLAPPTWSQAQFVDDHVVSFTNNSGRHVVVTSIEIEPDTTRAEAPARPHRVEYGDAFGLRWFESFSMPSPTKVIIGWHYEAEPSSEQTTERNL
ncbi:MULTISPECIES: hypothetical protein [unclassified Leucobacter]|uniref:hypothetical protein n=1 Tax=unclassified Leucobacter TaxID=2621730 RepID=UPI0030165FA5